MGPRALPGDPEAQAVPRVSAAQAAPAISRTRQSRTASTVRDTSSAAAIPPGAPIRKVPKSLASENQRRHCGAVHESWVKAVESAPIPSADEGRLRGERLVHD